MTAVSPRRLRFATKPRVPESSSSTSLSSSASDQTSNTNDASDDSDTDDEKRIFFGSHQPEEADVLARITELHPVASPVTSRRSSRSHWVKKRDSREFLRRKTLLVEAQSQDAILQPGGDKGKGKEKVWPGGFHEVCDTPRSTIDDCDDSPPRTTHTDTSDTPTKPNRQCAAPSELTLQFSALGVSTSSRALTSSDDSEEVEEPIEGCSDLGSEDGGSDKENVEVPYAGPEEDEEEVGPVKEAGISVGFDRPAEEEADFELDMGGLKLSDFADPEMDASGVPLGASHTLLDFATPAPFNRAMGIFDAPDSHESTAVSEICFLDGGEDTSQLTATPSILHEPAAEVDDLDLPLPVARAGPVIIPALSHHLAPIRADPGSPFRSLSSYADTQPIFDVETDVRVQAGSLSPEKALFTPKAIHPLGHSVPSGPPVAFPGVEKAQKTLKSSVSSGVPASVDRPRVVSSAKEKAAALAVRSQLDAAVRPNLMGPPQRTVSSSSSASSASAASSRSNSSKTITARPAGPPKAAQGSTTKPVNGLPARTFSRTVSEPTAALGARPMVPSRAANPTIPIRNGSTQPGARAARTVATKPTNKPATLATRPPLQSRSLLIHPAKPAASAQNVPVAKASRPALMFSAKPVVIPAAVAVEVPGKSLKRPFALTQPVVARTAVAISAGGAGGGSRPVLGMPQRLVQDSSGVHFSMGVASETYRPASSASYRSPARMGHRRVDGTPSRLGPGFGTPSRAMGTPSRSTPIKRPPIYLFTTAPIAPTVSSTPPRDVGAVEPSATAGPPASATRNVTDTLEVEAALGLPRGSSEDHDEVSFAIPKASITPSPPPAKDGKDKFVRTIPEEEEEENNISTTSGRPKRAPKPRQIAQSTAMKGKLAYSIVPSMSEKQLREATHANTQKNQVYLCAIDRQIVRKVGPRPPSPTSKIRTTIDRDEEEKKKGRGDRAKRRAGDSLPEDEKPVVEKVIMAKGPGEEDDYVTPARHLKKLKLAHIPFLGGGGGEERNVKWDKGVIVIRDDGQRLETLEGERPRARSAMRGNQVPLDKYGNLIATNRPQEKLKVQKVTVTAVFYDGEEPVPPPPAPSEATRSKKK